MKDMKNLSKRGLALFLTLVMCLGMLQITVFAADEPVAVENEIVLDSSVEAPNADAGDEAPAEEPAGEEEITAEEPAGEEEITAEEPAGEEETLAEEETTEYVINEDADKPGPDGGSDQEPAEPEQPECTKDEDCTAEKHDSECPKYEQGGETPDPNPDDVTVTVDGETEFVPFEDSKAVVNVDGGGKTIISVVVDGETVLDQAGGYGENGDGKSLVKGWNYTFEDGKSHTVVVTTGYKLTVKTRYVEPKVNAAAQSNYKTDETHDRSAPTYYTLVLPAGTLAEPIALLPLPSEDGNYPLRLLDAMDVIYPESMSSQSSEFVDKRFVTTFKPASDDPQEWIAQSVSEAEANPLAIVRYLNLKKMVEEDATFVLPYRYNESKRQIARRIEKPLGV